MLRQSIATLSNILGLRGKYNWDDIEVILIVSTGRTGTHFFAELFTAISNEIHALHEPQPDLFDLGLEYIRNGLTKTEVLSKLEDQRQIICNEVHKKDCRFYIESNTNLTYIVPILKEFYKNYKIIHVVRDGRDYVRSAYSKRLKPMETKDSGPLYFMSHLDKRSRLKAIDFVDDPYRSKWNDMSRFEKLCWFWVKMDSMILDAIDGDPNSISMKYEDLFNISNGYSKLWEMIKFLGVEDHVSVTNEMLKKLMTKKADHTEHYLLPTWDKLPKEQKQQFNTIAGNHMQRHGYINSNPSEI